MTKTNLEQYKKELGKIFYEGCGKPAAMFDKIKNNCDSDICSSYGQTYADAILDWMARPYKESILDDIERKYLSAVIKPFRNKVEYIMKEENICSSTEFIHIDLSGGDIADFPNFKANTMYKGMEVDKYYTLEELGL